MLRFRTFILEVSGKVDPILLAQRASRILGKRTDYGEWFNEVQKGKHIPLRNYDEKESDSVFDKLSDVRAFLGPKREGLERYKSSLESKRFKIKDLRPTQPYVRTDDEDILRNKIGIKDPDHIHIVRHNGNNYIINGHHAIMSARLRGEDHVTGSFYDLDKHS